MGRDIYHRVSAVDERLLQSAVLWAKHIERTLRMDELRQCNRAFNQLNANDLRASGQWLQQRLHTCGRNTLINLLGIGIELRRSVMASAGIAHSMGVEATRSAQYSAHVGRALGITQADQNLGIIHLLFHCLPWLNSRAGAGQAARCG